MMKKLRIILSFILLPLSILYGIVVFIRNKLYDYQWIPSRSFPIPLISVGNIAVGGTGKTPHIEYLAGLLKDEFTLAVLSRGYKRKRKGFQMVTNSSSAEMVGDEPLQIKNKYPEIAVAVDGNRVRGINRLMDMIPDLDLVLLDDAYQHRKVKVNLSLLLMDYHHRASRDFLLPLGNLREPFYEKRRANMMLITKSPPDIQPIERRIRLKKLKPYPYQQVFFTSLQYGSPRPVFKQESESSDERANIDMPDQDTTLLLVTGIANPKPLKKHIESNISEQVRPMRFPDHNYYSAGDIKKIRHRFTRIKGQKAIITTEKDAVRLRESAHLPADLKQQMFYIPIRVTFVNSRTDDFNKQIIEYVRKNKQHSFLYPQ